MSPVDATPVPAPLALEGLRAGPEGRYRLQEEIARGGMGVVCRAEDELLGRTLAVKVLLADPHRYPELARRFAMEARITGQLQHPGVPPVHEVGTLPDGRPFLAMKLIEGQTLAALLAARSSPLDSPGKWLAIFEMVCRTVAFAHSRGVIHRDIKPGNVMVGAFGEVQVMDWGVARLLSCQVPDLPDSWSEERGSPLPLSVGESMLGTPAYMPPERLRGERGDERSDVFGLGAILCEILTGETPSPGLAARPAPLARLLIGDTDALDRLQRCAAPADLCTLARSCLAANPADRPCSAGEVADRLAAHLADAGERVRKAELDRASAGARAEEAGKRRRLKLALATALLALMLGAGAVLLRHRGEKTRRLEEQARQVATANQTASHLLDQAEILAKRHQWEQGLETARAATAHLPLAGNEELTSRAEAITDALLLGRDLEKAREGRRLQLVAQTRDVPPLNPCAAVLERNGLVVRSGDLAKLAARITTSPIHRQVLAALYEWLYFTRDATEVGRLRAVLERVDRDSWRTRMRAATRRDELQQLADHLPVEPPPLGAVLLLARKLARAGGDELALRRRAQGRYPRQFWLAFDLATHPEIFPAEAVGLLRAAVALRSENAAAWNNLGSALMREERWQESEDALRQAVALAPDAQTIRTNLGFLLLARGKEDEAGKELDRILARGPLLPHGLLLRGLILSEAGNVKGAAEALAQAVETAPADPLLWLHLGRLRLRQGDSAAAGLAIGKALALAPEPTGALAASLIEAKARADFLVFARSDPVLAASFFAKTQPLWLASPADSRRAWLLQAAATAVEASQKAQPVRWRRQALTWLARHLDSWEQAGASAPRGRAMASLLKDPRFDAVRGPALERLPIEERAAWHRQWKRAERVLSGAVNESGERGQPDALLR